MRLISARRFGLVVLSAVLQVAAFPVAGPLPLWRASCGFVALVPLLCAILLPGREGKQPTAVAAALAGYFCGVLWYSGNCAWIYQTMYLYGGLDKPVALLILILFALYLGLYHALFALLLWSCGRRFTILAVLALSPFLWVAIELARARITGFPWDLLGYSQVDNLLLTRLAPLGGVMLISFVVAATNSVFAASFLAARKLRAIAFITAAACVLIFTAAHKLFVAPADAPPGNTAVLLQQNLSVGAAAKQEQRLTPAQELVEFSFRTLHPDGQNMTLPPAVIVWPEAPSHLQSGDPAFRATMASLARAAQAPLIVGSLGVDADATSPRGYLLYDSASLFERSGQYQGRYDKIHLVPWGEYIPFKQFFTFAQKLTEGAGDMDRGSIRTVFTTAGHTYGVFICYESIFGDEVRQFVRNGAEVLVNISDDGWYGDTGAPWQHLNMARMRAMENHRWLLRDTNTGITTAIDPYGRTLSPAPRHLRGAFVFPFAFEPANSLTFYTRHGDWFAWLCVAVSLTGLLYARTRGIV